jgi:Cohesin domain/Dockerin type I domain
MVNIDAPDFAAEDSLFIARINVTGVTGFYSADYEIVFDPSVFEVGNVTSGQIDGTLIPVDTWQVVTPGVIRVVQNAAELLGVSGSGYIAELHFHVIGSDSSSSEINFSNGVFNDINANQIPATWTGKAGIGVYKSGDANDDGSVNNLDITKLERIIIGSDDRTPGADANGDGNVNALDITKVELVMMGR